MHYKNKFKSSTSTRTAFKAITSGINQWWGRVDNTNLSKIGDQFTIFFEENTQWVFEVVSYIPNKSIRWKCIKALHYINGLEGIETEWFNSEIVWTITPEEDGISIEFEHLGLTPELNCFEACNSGWNYFISESLKQYLDTGIGTPNIVE